MFLCFLSPVGFVLFARASHHLEALLLVQIETHFDACSIKTALDDCDFVTTNIIVCH